MQLVAGRAHGVSISLFNAIVIHNRCSETAVDGCNGQFHFYMKPKAFIFSKISHVRMEMGERREIGRPTNPESRDCFLRTFGLRFQTPRTIVSFVRGLECHPCLPISPVASSPGLGTLRDYDVMNKPER